MHIGYVTDGALRVVAADGTGDRALAVPEAKNVSYGLAEFVGRRGDVPDPRVLVGT